MKYDLIISQRAYNDIDNHVAFLANVSIPSAKKLHSQIISELKSLSKNPLSHPILVLNNENTKYRKLFIPKRYLILYQIKNNDILIDYIVDCRQNYSWLIE